MGQKFILFIVEGKNDKIEIDTILHSDFFAEYKAKYDCRFEVVNGDITAASHVNENNIQSEINKIIMKFRNGGIPYNNISVRDIQEVVQIVDIDGCFIPNINIVNGDNSEFTYSDTNIITSNIDGAIGRNKKKSKVLRKLLSVDQIGNIPYSIYFVSCNMDHVLFNNRSLNRNQKDKCAYVFGKKCSQDSSILNDSIFRSGIKSNNYIESWDDIQNECNSLRRKTNFNLFFESGSKNVK